MAQYLTTYGVFNVRMTFTKWGIEFLLSYYPLLWHKYVGRRREDGHGEEAGEPDEEDEADAIEDEGGEAPLVLRVGGLRLQEKNNGMKNVQLLRAGFEPATYGYLLF